MSSSRLLAAFLLVACAQQASAQLQHVRYSINWHGPSVAKIDSNLATPITEGDVLLPPGGVPDFGPLSNPEILLRGLDLGILSWNSCVGHLPGDPCGVELDALSFGKDALLLPVMAHQPRVWFTVDEYAKGNVTNLGPNVSTEAAAQEASADVFVDTGIATFPVAPGTPGGNVAVFDGDGLLGASGNVYPGLGLVEPNPPTAVVPDEGDQLDGLDVSEAPLTVTDRAYFSLDSDIADPESGVNNSNSGFGNGVTGADILVVDLNLGLAAVYASAGQLGLISTAAIGDDVDAVILHENGDGLFTPSQIPFDWVGGDTDMLLFSVRRNSAIIGQPDSIFGQPIQPGDLLVPPVANGNGNPGIFIAAEALGLATQRQFPNLPHGDDLTGGDLDPEPFCDCNQNGVEDSVDIATGTSTDHNGNGIPDECEPPGDSFCLCTSGPCGNDDPGAGCANSLGAGSLLIGIGSSSVDTDDLVLSAGGLPSGQFGLIFMGDATTVAPTADGIRCLDAGPLGLYRFPAQPIGPSGTLDLGPGIVDLSCQLFPTEGCILMGQTWAFQGWYRDPQGPCGQNSNFTSAWAVTFTP